MRSKINEIIESHNNTDRSGLLDILQEIQEIEGYLSEEVIFEISNHFKLASAKIYGIASFYDCFKFSPQGKYHIRVCNGTACHLSDDTNVHLEFEKLLKINHGQCTRDGMYSIEYVPCMGACGHSPVISINGEYHTAVKSSDIKDLIENLEISEPSYE